MTAALPVSRPVLPPLGSLLPLLEEIWERGWVTNNGPVLRRFEARLAAELGWRNVVATTNATLALQLTFAAMRLEGEVVTTSFTAPATVQALHWNRLSPVFADIDPDHLTLDPDAVEAAITPRTSAIYPVHMFGNPADVEALGRIARRHGLALVYDGAMAVGTRFRGRPLSDYGDACVFSFHATKIVHTLEGGALSTADAALAERVGSLRSNALGLGEDGQPGAEGSNAKMSELQAALGLLALDLLAAEIRERRALTGLYARLLADVPGVRLVRPLPGAAANHTYLAVRLRRQGESAAERVQRALAAVSVDTRRYFGDRRFRPRGGLPTPVTDAASDDTLCLPLWSGLPHQSVRRICEVVREAMSRPPGRRVPATVRARGEEGGWRCIPS